MIHSRALIIVTLVAFVMLFGGFDSPAQQSDAPVSRNSKSTQQHSSAEPTSIKKFQREIFVPFDSLDILLDKNSNRVLLTRSQYEELLAAARVVEIKKAPIDSAILSAKYTGKIADGVAQITGELVIEPLTEGLIQIPLSLSGVALRAARLDDRPANLWRNADGQIGLLTSGAEQKLLRLEMTLPIQTSPARQLMSLQLPTPASTEFSLAVPGNVEIKSGAAVVQREYEEAQNITTFDLLPTREPMNIVMSLNNRLLKEDQVVVSRSVIIHKLSAASQEMHVTCSLDVIHGAIEEIQFGVPKDFEVSSVTSELLNQWEMVAGGQPDERHLRIKLRQPTREPVVLNITAMRTAGATGDWTATDIRPLDVAGQVTVVGVLADADMESADLEMADVIPIDHQFLLAAIPSSVSASESQRPVRVVAAGYAPQRDYSITARFSLPQPELIVASNSRLVIDNQQLELQGGLSLIVRHDSRFDFRLSLPELWRLNELTSADGSSIRFDRLVNTVANQRAEFLVHLPQRIAADSATRVFFKASLTPADWLENWQTNSLEFPHVSVDGETKHNGAISVASKEDLLLTPTNLNGLELLDDNDKQRFEFDRGDAPLAYRFDDPNYSLQVDLKRLQPSITARSYNFFTIQPNQLNVHAELVFDVKQAKTDQFEFELPLDSPASISIGAPGIRLKDYRSEVTESARRWTVQLAAPQTGKVHLLIDYLTPLLDKQRTELVLTPVAIQNVAFQTALFAIEGSSELDVEIKTDALPIDIGELSEAVYQPGRYTLGAFAASKDNVELKLISNRRPIYELPAAIVQRAEIVTSISNNGTSQSAARFQLATKPQSFLRIELPTNAKLWSVMLDGQPTKPQRHGSALLISLVGNEAEQLRDLQLVYESPIDAFHFMGQIEAQAPTLWLSESEAESSTPVPLVDLHWRLLMPDGFSVSHGDGSFQSKQLTRQLSPIQQFGNWIVRFGGGFTPLSESPFLMPGKRRAEKSVHAQFNTPVPATESLSSPADAELDVKLFTFDDATASRRTKYSILDELIRDSNEDPKDKQTAAKKSVAWALSGLRSLDIKLTDTGNSIEFYNLGQQPVLQATVFNQSRLNWFAITLALLITAMGVLLSQGKLRSKIFFLLLVLVIAGCIPLLGSAFDVFRTLIDLVLMAIVFLAIYFVVLAIAQRFFRTLAFVGTRIPLVVLFVSAILGMGNPISAQQIVNDANELKQLIAALQDDSAVKLPDDAIIIPFDADDPEGRNQADRMLLPYEYYLRLLATAKRDGDGVPDEQKLDSPVDFVISSSQYDVPLAMDDDIAINGRLTIEVLTDEAIAVELPLLGGALADATVDGKPAKLQIVSAAPANLNSSKPSTKQLRPATTTIKLHLEGRGTKTFSFTVRSKPRRQGGWRMLEMRLPVGVARELNLQTADDPTEVRLNSDADTRSINAQPNQQIASVLNEDGSLRLHWKPSDAEQTIDRSLTVNSEAMFDIREDGLRLTWQLVLDFRGSERDTFSLELPPGFLVEQIMGDNIRAWDVPENGDQNRLNVTLLAPAKDRETFTIELSQRDFSISEEPIAFNAPYLTVETAALHQGVYTIRRSPIIELKTTGMSAASRIDYNQEYECRLDVAGIDEKASPLGIETFQMMRFVTAPFEIGLQANVIPHTLSATTQTILRIGQSEAQLESRINIQVGKRPIYDLQLQLPADAEIRRLSAGLQESWTTEMVGGKQQIQFFFPAGVANNFSIVLESSLTNFTGSDEFAVPQIEVLEVEKQSSEIAVQVDPAISVSATNLQNCEAVLLQQIENWLNDQQRANTRLALRTKSADYDATLKFTKIEPRVTVETVTNIRTTRFAVEETILLDFDIQRAGIREIQFEMPVELRQANIVAKLVSETIFDEVVNNPAVVRVTLILQDEVIDSYRVVIEHDRALAGGQQSVPIPRVLTGTTENQFVTLQNAGRDEIEVASSADFQRLNRQLSQFAKLKQKLSDGELTMAYVAVAKRNAPKLQFETKQRESLDTVAASIEFSKTTMVVDASGAYRALQNFQIDNRSEQYLEIELPAGARLLTVVVAGQPIKPVAWNAANNDRRLRVPLVKTPPGDLDYPVQLKYAGQLGALRNFQTVGFPLIETLNINVQLSQLHLRLPESHRWWNFDGTMTKVDSRGELEESFLTYKANQIQKLAEQLQSDDSDFRSSYSYSKSRALGNLNKLGQEMAEYASKNAQDSSGTTEKAKQITMFNGQAIEQAQESYQGRQVEANAATSDNRALFNLLVENQSAKLARNAVTRSGQNFQSNEVDRAGAVVQAPPQTDGQSSDDPFVVDDSESLGNGKFDQKWFSRNQLESQQQTYQVPTPNAPQTAFEVPNLSLVISQSQTIVPPDERLVDNSVGYLNAEDKKLGTQVFEKEQRDDLRIADEDLLRENEQAGGQQAGKGGLSGGFGGGLDGRMAGELQGGRGDRQESDTGERSSVVGRSPIEPGGEGEFDGKRLESFGEQRLKNKSGSGEDLTENTPFAPPTRPSSGKDTMSTSALTSLDIELPERGVDFYFKSPRGNANVTVRSLDSRTFNHWTAALVTIGICLIVALVVNLFHRVRQNSVVRILATGFLLIAGLISLASGTLPIYGLLAVVAGLVLIFESLARMLENSTSRSVVET